MSESDTVGWCLADTPCSIMVETSLLVERDTTMYVGKLLALRLKNSVVPKPKLERLSLLEWRFNASIDRIR